MTIQGKIPEEQLLTLLRGWMLRRTKYCIYTRNKLKTCPKCEFNNPDDCTQNAGLWFDLLRQVIPDDITMDEAQQIIKTLYGKFKRNKYEADPKYYILLSIEGMDCRIKIWQVMNILGYDIENIFNKARSKQLPEY